MLELTVGDVRLEINACDPGQHLTEEVVQFAVRNIAALERLESSMQNGDVRWLHMKVKENADFHGIAYDLTERWAGYYEGYKADLEYRTLSMIGRIRADWQIKSGSRPSFRRRLYEEPIPRPE